MFGWVGFVSLPTRSCSTPSKPAEVFIPARLAPSCASGRFQPSIWHAPDTAYQHHPSAASGVPMRQSSEPVPSSPQALIPPAFALHACLPRPLPKYKQTAHLAPRIGFDRACDQGGPSLRRPSCRHWPDAARSPATIRIGSDASAWAPFTLSTTVTLSEYVPSDRFRGRSTCCTR